MTFHPQLKTVPSQVPQQPTVSLVWPMVMSPRTRTPGTPRKLDGRQDSDKGVLRRQKLKRAFWTIRLFSKASWMISFLAVSGDATGEYAIKG